MIRKNKSGFTLVELLVVIAIIGILASVVLVSLNTARQKARDVRRIADIRQVTLALENYYDDNLAYPVAISSLAPDYIASVPTDPQNGSAYLYNSSSCSPANQKFVIGTTLENDNHTAFDNDVDGTQCTVSCVDSSNRYCLMP